MTTTLDGRQETPPITSPGIGTGTATVDMAANTITFNVTYSGTISPANAAHLHGPADPGQSAGILIGFPSPASPITGTFNYAQSNEVDILEGRTYINIHTPTFPGGEIRGQVINAENYCWGDGSGTACPCGNASIPGRGCVNSTGNGALLLVTGNNAAGGGNNNEFFGFDLRPSQPALLFMGTSKVAGGDGAVFGDGLRCVGMNVVRLGVKLPDAGGKAVWTPTAILNGLSPGNLRFFQVWYRDPGGLPCGSNFNLSNGLGILFV